MKGMVGVQLWLYSAVSGNLQSRERNRGSFSLDFRERKSAVFSVFVCGQNKGMMMSSRSCLDLSPLFANSHLLPSLSLVQGTFLLASGVLCQNCH